MVSKQTANIVAVVVAMVVLIIGAVVVAAHGPTFAAPTKTTTVEETGQGAGVANKTTTTARKSTGSAKPERSVTSVVAEPSGNPSSKTTTTTEVSSRSFLERALGNGGLVLLEGAVVLLAAFIAGAFTQRVLVGDFALKLGPLELGALQAGNEQTITELAGKIAAINDLQAQHAKDLAAVGTNVADVSTALVTMGSVMSDLRNRVQRLEDQGGRET